MRLEGDSVRTSLSEVGSIQLTSDPQLLGDPSPPLLANSSQLWPRTICKRESCSCGQGMPGHLLAVLPFLLDKERGQVPKLEGAFLRTGVVLQSLD